MTERTNLPSRPPGRSINRRQALAGLGGLGLSALLVACGKDGTPDPAAAGSTSTTAALLDAAGSCAVVPELTEGPYYIDVDKVRSDLREDRPGTPLTLAIRVRDYPGCTPRAIQTAARCWSMRAARSWASRIPSGADAVGRAGATPPSATHADTSATHQAAILQQ